MSWTTVWVLFIHEMRMLLRDRRTVVMALVLPMAIMPVMLFGTKKMQEIRLARLGKTVYRYAIVGSQQEDLRQLIETGRRAAAVRDRLEKQKPDSPARFKSVEITVPDARVGLRSGQIHFYLETLSGKEADDLPPRSDVDEDALRPSVGGKANPLASEPVRLPGVPLARICYQGNDDNSQAGRSMMREFLRFARQAGRDELLKQRGLPIEPKEVLKAEDKGIATAAEVTGSRIGRFLTAFILMLMLSGGSVVALDIVSGEKERGSLETLLTTAALRGEIVAAKQLAILSVALVITFIQVANMLVYVTLKVIELPEDFVVEVPPAAALTLLLLFLPVALLVAAILLMLSAYAKSYKEAQLYFFPVYMASLVPSLAAVLPGISLRSAIVLAPLANVSVAVREVMVGKYDWPMILVTFLVMGAAAAWTLRASARMLSQERLITTSDHDAADLEGGPALFSRHVLRWYAVLGAILFTVALNVPQLSTFRGQLLFNELGLFLAAPLLMIWKYRLGWREALALRKVKPAVWIGVLLAIPSGHVVAIGIFRLANLVLPVPRQVLEQFSREILPDTIPLWQLVLFVSILPGICEEIAFRGPLLYGLRRRLRPAQLALTVGLIFGLFHVALFRIIPTGFLGVVLTALGLLTGSIFPCMLMHAGNNALGLWAAKAGIQVAALPWWVYVTAALLFCLSFYVFYRNRTPYPGLRRQTK